MRAVLERSVTIAQDPSHGQSLHTYAQRHSNMQGCKRYSLGAVFTKTQVVRAMPRANVLQNSAYPESVFGRWSCWAAPYDPSWTPSCRETAHQCSHWLDNDG